MENQQQAPGKTFQRGGKPKWTIVKTFEDKDSGLVVQVTALAFFKGTEYNWELEQLRGRDGQLFRTRHVRPRLAEGSNPAVAVIAKDGMRAARLIDEALLWIEGRKQFDLDNQIEQKQYYENRAIEREQRGPQQQAGLSKFVTGSKTEREQAKHQRHEANLSARRAADQERTRTTKGKG